MKFQDFYKKFQIDPDSFFDRNLVFLSTQNPRITILNSELNDFNKLLSELKLFINKLRETQIFILERYKLEGRNSFNSKILLSYEEALLKLKDLEQNLESQDSFYQSRIKEIKCELNKLK